MQRRSRESVRDAWGGDVSELSYHEQGYSTRAQHGMKRVQGMYPNYHTTHGDLRHVRMQNGTKAYRVGTVGTVAASPRTRHIYGRYTIIKSKGFIALATKRCSNSTIRGYTGYCTTHKKKWQRRQSPRLTERMLKKSRLFLKRKNQHLQQAPRP